MLLFMKVRAYVLSLILAVSSLLLMPVMALADTITVDTTADQFNTSGSCSLRDAIESANTNTAVGGCVAGQWGTDTVNIPTGIYTLTLVGSSEDSNATGDLDVYSDWGGIILNGMGVFSSDVVIDANGIDRAIHGFVEVTIANLTIKGGDSDSGGGAYFYNSATVIDTTFSNNTSSYSSGGGAYFYASATVIDTTFRSNTSNDGNGGGGAYFNGSVNIIGTAFISNISTGGHGSGASFYGDAYITNTIFMSNSLSSVGNGSGAYFFRPATLLDVVFSNNTGASRGGGVYFDSMAVANVADTTFQNNTATEGGGGYFYSLAAVTNTQFISNSTYYDGGGAYFYDDATIIDTHFMSNTSASKDAGGALFYAGANVINSSFISNTTKSDGGGAYFNASANVTGSSFISNTAIRFSGGGAYFSDITNITETTFIGNASLDRNGGGAYFDKSATVTSVTFGNNTSHMGGGGAEFMNPTVITNSTFISNTSWYGGGAEFANVASVINSSFISNTTIYYGGGAEFSDATVIGTIFQNNTAGYGGGAAFMGNTAYVKDTHFINNSAVYYGYGGGAFFANNTQLVNSLFSRNSASINGAAIYADGYGTLKILHSTIASPTLVSNEAVYVVGTAYAYITNSIIASHTTGIWGMAAEDYNLFYGNSADTNWGVTSGGNSLMGQDPLFVAPLSDNYHLQFGSPASGLGTPLGVLTDYDGETRSTTAPASGYDEVIYIPPTISIANASQVENNSPLVFTVTLSAASPLDISLNYATSDQTATAGSDYVATSGVLTITAGNTEGLITVSFTDDFVKESDEILSLTLSNPVNATFGNNTGVGTILDDDTVGLLVSAISGDTTEVGGTANFTLQLHSAPTATVTISLTSSNLIEGNIVSPTLIFDAANWNIPQTVIVSGVDDLVQDGAQNYFITGTTSSSDLNYDGLSLNVAVINQDNDGPLPPVNQNPHGVVDSYSVNQEGIMAIGAPGVLANDSDPENQPLSVSVVTQPQHGSLVLLANGSFTYTPAAGFSGTDNFIYLLSDGNGGSMSVNVGLTVNPSATATLTATATATMTATPTVTATPTMTVTPTITATATIMPPLMTATAPPTVTVTVIMTPTPTITMTVTPTPIITSSATPTSTVMPTETVTPTPMSTPTATPTGFQVNPHGFRFKDFKFDSPYWDLFKATFPQSVMELPDGTRRQGAVTIFENSYYKMGNNGNNVGLSVASIINYLHTPETVERNVLTSEHRAINLMYDMPEVVTGNVHGGDSDVKDYINIYQARQMSLQHARWFRTHISDTVLQTYEVVKNKTATNEPMSIKLFTPDGLHSHRVTAYRTTEISTTAYIYVYDGNWPNDSNRRIEIDLTSGTWEYTLRAGKVWSNTTSLYALPVDVNFPAEIYITPNGRARANSNSETWLSLTGDGQLLITDNQERKLGYVNGRFVSEIPDAVRLLEDTSNIDDNTENQSVEIFFLPADISYTISVATSGGYTLTAVAVSNGATMSLSNAMASDRIDTLMVNGNIFSTTFTPAALSTYCQILTFEEMEASRSFNTCTHTASPVSFGLNSMGNQLTLSNGGAAPISVTTTINQVGAGASNQTVTNTIATGNSVFVTVKTNGQIYLPMIVK